jgi:hypothetical protein
MSLGSVVCVFLSVRGNAAVQCTDDSTRGDKILRNKHSSGLMTYTSGHVFGEKKNNLQSTLTVNDWVLSKSSS